MPPEGVLLIAAAIVAVALLLQVLLQRRELSRLRRQLDRSSAELERLQRAFGRFAPPEIVERVIASGVSTSGERKEVTALFADLAGYTALADRVDPSVLVRIMNGYFERMGRAITGHSGHLSALIGDGILALFGALEPDPWQANDAGHAALAMRSELIEYNRELEKDGFEPLSIGIGLHKGIGVAGLVGTKDLMQYAFVGSTINVAARLQTLTRSLGADILLTRQVRDALDTRFDVRELPATEVRGLSEPLVTFALEGYDTRT